jgi:hypothetical protein
MCRSVSPTPQQPGIIRQVDPSRPDRTDVAVGQSPDPSRMSKALYMAVAILAIVAALALALRLVGSPDFWANFWRLLALAVAVNVGIWLGRRLRK